MPQVSSSLAVLPLNLRRTFALQNLGRYDPTASLEEHCFTKAFATAGGICAVTVEAVAGGLRLTCDGPDAEGIHGELSASFAAEDGHDAFRPEHPLLKRLRRDQAGLRLWRMPWLYDLACSAVLQQRVRAVDAMSDWRHVVHKFGGRSASGLIAFPDAASLASVAVWELEALGIDARRSRTLVALAREVKMVPLDATMSFAALRARLASITGMGPWTVETVSGFGAADQDALPLGDLYLPGLVCYALAGEAEGTDARMVELLEPFRGHRFRVARLLFGGRIEVPRTGPSRRTTGERPDRLRRPFRG